MNSDTKNSQERTVVNNLLRWIYAFITYILPLGIIVYFAVTFNDDTFFRSLLSILADVGIDISKFTAVLITTTIVFISAIPFLFAFIILPMRLLPKFPYSNQKALIMTGVPFINLLIIFGYGGMVALQYEGLFYVAITIVSVLFYWLLFEAPIHGTVMKKEKKDWYGGASFFSLSLWVFAAILVGLSVVTLYIFNNAMSALVSIIYFFLSVFVTTRFMLLEMGDWHNQYYRMTHRRGRHRLG